MSNPDHTPTSPTPLQAATARVPALRAAARGYLDSPSDDNGLALGLTADYLKALSHLASTLADQHAATAGHPTTPKVFIDSRVLGAVGDVFDRLADRGHLTADDSTVAHLADLLTQEH
ncbi:hypothetical protein [Kineococcus terrestris]|uniref:hypothetical protein n=1 Tax=Kineococcus terrestris TaxID=2044856 RepID=UPI0034DB3A5D